MAGVELFLIKRMSSYVDTKETQRHLLDTAVSLNKGDFNTPSVFLFFKKEYGGFDCYFKTAAIQIGRVLADEQRFLSVAICQQSHSRSSYLKRKEPTTMSN